MIRIGSPIYLAKKKEEKKDKNLDYILGVVDEEISHLRDEIETQNREIENVKEPLDKIDKVKKNKFLC